MLEFFACLAIAVCLFKTFLLEGYIIPTGSMAPTLLGRHRVVPCPACGHQFAVGATTREVSWANCPNCDQARISLANIPLTEGDQLLVQKSAYQFRSPRRWEAAVFHNPQNLSEAYVKRIVGLPGETVEILKGEVYIDGTLARKPIAAQRACAILIHDSNATPTGTDPDWQPRWRAEQPWWQPRGGGFAGDTRPDRPDVGRSPDWGWLTYRHWLRAGGRHLTRVELADWPAQFPPPKPQWDRLTYDAASRRLSYRGVLSAAERERYRLTAKTSPWERALDKLWADSHAGPITDSYAYNASTSPAAEFVVRDLLVSLDLHYKSGTGEFRCDLFDGRQTFQLICDTHTSEVRLQRDGQPQPLRTAKLPVNFFEQRVRLEFSNIDQQLCCALDGRELFEPYPFEPATDTPAGYPRQPVKIGIRGLRLHLLGLRLYRDLYYTPDGTHQVQQLESTAQQRTYFVLGDNSPVSIDSRYWPPHALLDEKLLIGKPFLVHLPARTWPVSWQGRTFYWRIPDWSRIRYIH